MANIDKTKLNQVFRLTEEEDIYDFLKEEVYRNASLAKKLIKQFLPDDTKNIDSRQEVKDIFLCADEFNYFYQCDEIWHVGDIGTMEVADKLREIAPLRAVYGNIDGTFAYGTKVDRRLGMLHINPGAAGLYGQQPVRTLIRFIIDGENIKDLEIIELNKQYRLS